MIEYPYLPNGRNILYVPIDNPFMKAAKEFRDQNSTDHLIPTGAVVVLNGEIIGRAANRSNLKNKRLIELHQNGWCIRKIFKVKTGEKYWLCPGCTSHQNHAELWAIKDAIKNYKNPEGADLYMYGHWWCCKPCWDAMIKASIRNVYLLEGSEKYFDHRRPKIAIGK